MLSKEKEIKKREEEDQIENDMHYLLSGLFSSIKETNRRIDEIKYILQNPNCTPELARELRDRTFRLKETKFCLIYSVCDIRLKITRIRNEEERERMCNILEINHLYKELKNL
jgi:hypothetical protein